MRKIKYLDLKKLNARFLDEIDVAVRDVLQSGRYLNGDTLREFEMNYAEYISTDYTIACGNGLDALTLILLGYKELGRFKSGDEIIVPANTFIATILSVIRAGLKPVLVEPDPETFQIDPSQIRKVINPKTKGVIIVHLYGNCAYDETINQICKENSLLLLEDNAQAHGTLFKGKRTGSLGDAGAHSFYPSKNLGSFGDGGAVTTNNADLAELVRSLANYGSKGKYVFESKGLNSRMDEIQAAIINVKLKYLDADNQKRREIAGKYIDGIKHTDIVLPKKLLESGSVFHVFPILSERRDELQKYLEKNGIETLIHYPVPPHKQKALREYSSLDLPITEKIHRHELSLPISPTLEGGEIEYICEILSKF